MQDWAERFVAETTSYVVALWTDPEAPAGPPLQEGAAVTLIGGDTFFGRAWPRLLVDELAARRVEAAVRAVTRGRPLVVNLEGVLMEEVPSTLGPLTLGMPAGLALDWLTRLGVIGVSLANNHALDLGPAGLEETRAALAAAGIAAAAQGDRLALPGGAALVALTDLGGPGASALRLDPAALDALVEPDATVPVVAFLHWGREGLAAPGPRELALAEEMRARGVAAVLGAHPHVASPGAVALGGGDTALLHSLGNFLFDQTGPATSGALAELWVFPQGTVFLRPLPLPDLFGLALGR
jgi:poly-gamma-glutamate synthesis protein (capsule biosynthesis protein)